MGPHLNEWLSLALRWLHVVAGVVWIGESFNFMWLDASLEKLQETPDGVKGESWSVHGGGFYRVLKFSVAPPVMPKTLHWFVWEAMTTWGSGLFLLMVVYWMQAEAYMVDIGVAELTGKQAVGVGLGAILAGIAGYEAVVRSALKSSSVAVGIVLAAYFGAMAYGLSELLAPRAAYIHMGAILGSVMAFNVAGVIIPNQRKMVKTMVDGGVVDPALGAIAKLRSTHNNYLTLPVIFVMISNHYPSTYGHAWNWLILIGLFGVGALARVFFNLRNSGRDLPALLAISGAGFLAITLITAPWPADEPEVPLGVEATPIEAPAFAEIEVLIATHCRSCHSANPTDDIFRAAPLGVKYDTPAEIQAKANQIKLRAVDTKTMPFGNKTDMTDAERALLGRWVAAGAPGP
jgi:uncharacterized membrane protein